MSSQDKPSSASSYFRSLFRVWLGLFAFNLFVNLTPLFEELNSKELDSAASVEVAVEVCGPDSLWASRSSSPAWVFFCAAVGVAGSGSSLNMAKGVSGGSFSVEFLSLYLFSFFTESGRAESLHSPEQGRAPPAFFLS